MSNVTTTAERIPVWAYLIAVLSLIALYLMLHDNGAVLSTVAPHVHEFTHDGRHILGVPCH
ncbi:CbtB-domain containing protein [Kribbella sp. NPDC050281]|uniref:CbtB-domain containing protein n=1 Tax=Kribbella sp. NPDC050281 TaxID=3155515 RepID=UPI0033DE4A53